MLSDILSYNYECKHAVEYDLWDKDKKEWNNNKKKWDKFEQRFDHFDYSAWCETPAERTERNRQYFLCDKKLIETEDSITIPQTIKIELKEINNNNNIVDFIIIGKPLASLSFRKVVVKDCFNTGPYMDILSHSLQPIKKNACICMDDSSGGTPLEEYRKTTHQSQSSGINISAAVGLSCNLPVINIGPSFNASVSNGSSIDTKETEFKQTRYDEPGQKKILLYSLNKCYYKNTPVPYDVYKISTLQKNMDVVNDYGTSCWRELNTPPSIATSALDANWSIQYTLPKKPVQFECTTEVRVVFGSSNRIWRKPNVEEALSWIKTVHQIKTVFEINIDETQQKASIQLVSRKTKRISSHGFSAFKEEKVHTQKRILVEGEGKGKEINGPEALQEMIQALEDKVDKEQTILLMCTFGKFQKLDQKEIKELEQKKERIKDINASIEAIQKAIQELKNEQKARQKTIQKIPQEFNIPT